MKFVSHLREPLILGVKNYKQVTDDLCVNVESKHGKYWYIAIGISLSAFLIGVISSFITIYEGIGTWGLNKTVNWAMDITNFVWWIGIGHAGTFISAILLILKQRWRTAVSRTAEAMTIFAVMCAGFFPLIHMGRPWLFFYIIPYPNTRGPLWVNFNSALVWDFFAIFTYFTVSLLFWYTGLIPDIATLRDRTKSRLRRFVYNVLSFGWSGSLKQWHRHEVLSTILAGLATPLVVSVHSIVNLDFATSVIPGWHSTIFPPYFVIGAIFSGFAMVQTLVIIMRKVFKLENYITLKHIETMNKMLLLTGSLVGIAYFTEIFMAWYSNNPYEFSVVLNRIKGPYRWLYWLMLLFNAIFPQLFWLKRVRTSILATFIISILINVGMWLERFVIIVTSLHRDYLPSSWTIYIPSIVEIGLFIGTLGFFFTAFLIFAKFFPVVSIAEIKSIFKVSSEVVKGDGKPVKDNKPVELPRFSSFRGQQFMIIYNDENKLIEGLKKFVSLNFKVVDVFTPFHIHGVDEILNLKKTRLPKVAFFAGSIGAVTGFVFQSWVHALDWPMNFGGKPYFSFLSFIPITFELTVLFSALASVFSFFYRSKLFPGVKSRNPIIDDAGDKFVVLIDFDEFSLRREIIDKLYEIAFETGAIEIKIKQEK